MMDREEALALLKTYNTRESLITHALSVEAVMRRFAQYYGEDEEYWARIGLLHDIDYELYPDQHCKMAPTLLREAGIDDEMIRAVVSHGWGICTDVEPVKQVEKVLYTIDELTGLITATALMRPSKSLHDLTVKSVTKKWKTKGFSVGVDRDLIQKGCDMLPMERNDVIQLTIEGMRTVAADIGLEGTPQV